MYPDPNFKGDAPPPSYAPPPAFPSPYPPNLAGPSGYGTGPPPIYPPGPSVQPNYIPGQVPSYPTPGFSKPPPGYPYGVPPAMPPPPPPHLQASVVVTSSQQTIVALPQRAYRTYMAWSIINMLFFDFVFGLVALMFSIKTQKSIRSGEFILAANYSRKAFIFNLTALILGVIMHVSWIAVVISQFTARHPYSFLTYNPYIHY